MAKADILHPPNPIPDERLCLSFISRHPTLAAEARVVPSLKVVCGMPLETAVRASAVQAATM